jgi:hypothetical protein
MQSDTNRSRSKKSVTATSDYFHRSSASKATVLFNNNATPYCFFWPTRNAIQESHAAEPLSEILARLH